MLHALRRALGRDDPQTDILPEASPGSRESEESLLAYGVECHTNGRFGAAERAYRRILSCDPGHADALHLLGVLAHQSRRHEIAVGLIDQAITRNGQVAAYYNNRGDALLSLGLYERAEASFRRALTLDPQTIGTRNNLGLALYYQKRLQDAALCFKRVLKSDPQFVAAYSNMGMVMRALGSWQTAAVCHRRALELTPNQAETWQNLGVALHEARQSEEEEQCYRRALRLFPAYAEACFGLGSILQDLGRIGEAVGVFQRALEILPHYVDVWNNLGNALNDFGLIASAQQCHLRATRLSPHEARGHYNLGNSLRGSLNVSGAIDAWRRVLELDPEHPKVLGQLANFRKFGCDWEGADAEDLTLLAQLRLGRAEVPPFILFSTGAPPADQMACAQKWAKTFSSRAAALAPPPRPAAPRKIHLGYLSADFRDHPVASLIVELFERHDRSRFQVSGYSLGPDDQSALRRRLEASFDRFVDLRGVAHKQASDLIRRDQVDILVDLSGFTQFSRAQIPARRPAPVQVSFLGFPGTMGADFIDYIIGDGFLLPMTQQPFYSERIVQLPDCFQPSDQHRPVATEQPSRNQLGLPETGFIFCCFNASYKLTRPMFELWMRLLRCVPDSVLWLLDYNTTATHNLRREASNLDVNPNRLIFAPRLPRAEYLARMPVADLFLDTTPFSAGAVANDALWVGLPILTCAGATYVGRMAGSLLHAVGLPELVTHTLAAYETLALRLATDHTYRGELRRRLVANRLTAPLFNSRSYVDHIEAAYATMWQRWCKELPVDSLVIDR
jgi:predicted O-linked N-acetylglucosamine transferase (SPINDLY family)